MILVLVSIGLMAVAILGEPQDALAQVPFVLPKIQLGFSQPGSTGEVATGLQILALLTVLTMAPSILIMMTSFSRIVIVLAFMRQALGTQQSPPNQILVGMAMFLTLFSMAPVGLRINSEALQPFFAEQIDFTTAAQRASTPLRNFMLKQTREKDLALFLGLAGGERPASANDVPLTTLIPAFLISELKTAFQIGFMLFIPFLIVDMVVASVLLSLGMMMLPPILISLPFKLMLFVMVDGWALIIGSLMRSFA